jgi:LPXTG-motif cell wall-anchored protein
VIGYDLKTQVRIFEDISRRYERFRSQTGTNRGAVERATRPSVLAGGALVLLLAGYLLWRRKRTPKLSPTEASEKPRVDPKLEAATALYRALEMALATQGIPRPPALPPLRHAEDLTARQHPLGRSILDLTNRYLEARFGGEVLDESAQREFEKKVKEIRAFKPPPTTAAGAA